MLMISCVEGETTPSSSCADVTIIWICLICTEEAAAVAIMVATEPPMQPYLALGKTVPQKPAWLKILRLAAVGPLA